MRTSIDSATHRANAAGNHDTAHGFAIGRRVVTFTDATAATDTNADTTINTTTHSVLYSVAFA